MNEEKGNGLGNLLVAFLAGAAVGAAVALLTSPKSGPEMRETLAGLGKNLGSKIREKVDAVAGCGCSAENDEV
jgi:gas vesicle protein